MSPRSSSTAGIADTVNAALADERAAEVRLVVGIDAPALAATRPIVDYEDLIAGADPAEPADQRLGGPMFYTSGTTGRPKGVRGSLLGNADMTPDVLKLVAGGFASMFPIPGTHAAVRAVLPLGPVGLLVPPADRRLRRGDAAQVRRGRRARADRRATA